MVVVCEKGALTLKRASVFGGVICRRRIVSVRSSEADRHGERKRAVRARFAPSPTGSLHLGGARTALFNYLLVRGAKLRGEVGADDDEATALILRIEDTDAARGSSASEAEIARDLRWLGVEWDEGPDVAGSRWGPYRSSERAAQGIYADAIEQLIDSGHAYRDFSAAGLREEEEEDDDDDGSWAGSASSSKKSASWTRWRDAPNDEVASMLRAGAPHAVRFRVPRQGGSKEGPLKTHRAREVRDAIRGSLEWRDVARSLPVDFALARRDGAPLYNLCAAVDDAAMRVTHVVRGDEHVANTLKQVLVLEALGVSELPTYAHCALVVDADRKKLSKRQIAAQRRQSTNRGDDDQEPKAFVSGATVDAMRRDGATPLALATYLASLGFSAADAPGGLKNKDASSQENTEIFDSLDAVAERFDLARVSPAPAAYNPDKLRWLDARLFAALDKNAKTRAVRGQLERRLLCVEPVNSRRFRDVDVCFARDDDEEDRSAISLDDDHREKPASVAGLSSSSSSSSSSSPLPEPFVAFCAATLFAEDAVTAFEIGRMVGDALAYDATALAAHFEDNDAADDALRAAVADVARHVVDQHALGRFPVAPPTTTTTTSKSTTADDADRHDAAFEAWAAWLAAAADTLPHHKRRNVMRATRLVLTTRTSGPELHRNLHLVAVAAESGVPNVVPLRDRVAHLRRHLERCRATRETTAARAA